MCPFAILLQETPASQSKNGEQLHVHTDKSNCTFEMDRTGANGENSAHFIIMPLLDRSAALIVSR